MLSINCIMSGLTKPLVGSTTRMLPVAVRSRAAARQKVGLLVNLYLPCILFARKLLLFVLMVAIIARASCVSSAVRRA